jgi:hypothetical protein
MPSPPPRPVSSSDKVVTNGPIFSMTNVPCPGCVSTRSRVMSHFTASRTVFLDASYCSLNSSSVGSRAPWRPVRRTGFSAADPRRSGGTWDRASNPCRPSRHTSLARSVTLRSHCQHCSAIKATSRFRRRVSIRANTNFNRALVKPKGKKQVGGRFGPGCFLRFVRPRLQWTLAAVGNVADVDHNWYLLTR